MKKVRFAACLAFLSFLAHAGSANADRIQLPSDPDLSVSVGIGAFLGRRSDSIEFVRIQPPYFRLETTLFRRKGGWFNRLNLYGSLSLEFVDISYRNKLKLVTVEDDMGNAYEIKEDGLERADLSSGGELSGGLGARLSLFDSPHLFSRKHLVGLHVDVFGEMAGSFRRMPADPDILLVSWKGLELNVASLAREHAELSMKWSFLHYGATIGVPIRRWKGVKSLRLTPFLTVGHLRFNAEVDLAIDEDFRRSLEALGADLSAIPVKYGVDIDNFSGSVGARLDIGKMSAIETAGSFLATKSGTRVFWATLSYTMRFDYPW